MSIPAFAMRFKTHLRRVDKQSAPKDTRTQLGDVSAHGRISAMGDRVVCGLLERRGVPRVRTLSAKWVWPGVPSQTPTRLEIAPPAAELQRAGPLSSMKRAEGEEGRSNTAQRIEGLHKGCGVSIERASVIRVKADMIASIRVSVKRAVKEDLHTELESGRVATLANARIRKPKI